MNNCCPFVHVLRKVAFFALVGAAVIFLSGPVVAILSFVVGAGLFVFFFLLPFALLGFLIWLPVRILLGKGASARRTLARTTRVMGQAAFVVPARTCVHIHAKATRFGERVHTLTSFIGAVFLEVVSGAMVGALFGAVAGWNTQVFPYSIPGGAVVGIGLGVIVGASRLRHSAEHFSGQATD